MKHLCDSSVFLALSLGNHPHHAVAAAWMDALAEQDGACFCRATQQSYLRLLTVSTTLKGETRSNDEAIAAWRTLSSDPRIDLVMGEPRGLETRWLALAGHPSAAPKRWMDAYLAAFAICAGMRFVTFDQGFEQYRKQGLDLLILGADVAPA